MHPPSHARSSRSARAALALGAALPVWPQQHSRRTLLGSCAAVVCAGLMINTLPALAADHSVAPNPADIQSAWHATSRLGYGPSPSDSPGQITNARAWAADQLALATQAATQPARVPDTLNHLRAPLSEVFAGAEHDRTAGLNGTPRSYTREITRQAHAWRLHACSQPGTEPPLLARLTEFWFNHLNVYDGKGAVRPFVGHYVLHAIRPHVLGRYEDLLLASARHPAMLHYLDQARSVAESGSGSPRPGAMAGPNAPARRGLNENYARELLELHTLGVHGGYTQHDVRELARALTGWTLDPQAADGFRFAARQHDNGAKTLLGQPLHGTGMAEGDNALRFLARHPATAQRISLRLAQFFVADEPPQALVQQLAARYLATQGNLHAVTDTLINSPAFWSATQPLFKTPLDFACSALTAVGGPGEAQDSQQTVRFLTSAGQPLNGWPTPDGYTTQAATWLSPEALSRRADFALALGQRHAGSRHLLAWLGPATRERLQREPLNQQVGLALASPDFMQK